MGSSYTVKRRLQNFENKKSIPCTGAAFGQMCHLKYGEDTRGHRWHESVVHGPYVRGRRKFFDFVYSLNFMNKSEGQVPLDK